MGGDKYKDDREQNQSMKNTVLSLSSELMIMMIKWKDHPIYGGSQSPKMGRVVQQLGAPTTHKIMVAAKRVLRGKVFGV